MIAEVIIAPPIKVFVLGTSLIPNSGNQTQKIPPRTSVSESSVKSAAGKYLAFVVYKITPEQTKNPCNAESEVFFKDINILLSLNNKTKRETAAQKIPAIATVVNFGVFFLHLRETVNPAKPNDESNPLTKPNSVPSPLLSNDINIMPAAAIIMAIKVVVEIFSFKKTYAKIAAMKGIAANIIMVTAAVVVVIERIKVMLPIPRLAPPINPDNPILL